MRPLSNGDACSNAAAESLVDHVHRLRRLVWDYVRTHGPATCDEVEQALGLSHQTCSARFAELHGCGSLHREGKRPTRSGRPAWVHYATKIEPVQ